MGDLNSIRSERDRAGCCYTKRDIVMFNDFIEDLHLIEIDGEISFTWYGPKNNEE